MVTIIAAYSFYLYQVILRGEEIALPAFALVGVAGTFVILTPMIDVRYVVGKAVTYVVMGVSVWLVSGGGKWADTGVIWTLAYVVNIGLAAAIQILRVLRCDTEAVREFRARAAIREAERHRQEVELAVAKEIQDSFAPAPLELEGSGMRAFCYQKKYAPLGGDWLAVRRMEDGSLVAIVADATGKGVQASLVVHAVQSLWASALGESTFDPATWLRHLNRVLLTMGRTRLQTVTIGLLQIDRDRVTYWSAGHVPAFVVSGQGGDRELHRLVGRGSLLGMEENPPLEPVSFSLQGLSDPQILIGSDGVFDAGTLTRKSYVFSLLDHLEFRGEGPWSLCRAEDDKILIWIRQTAGEGVLANAS